MPPGTETAGQPFSLAAFPHSDGPLNSFFDPTVRRIVLQWGTRLGKTTLCLSLAAYVAATNPRNMMFSSPDKAASGKVVGSRLYPILESTDGVKDQLLPAHRRSVLQVKLAACRIFVGWSGSASSLADVGAAYGIGNEIDKWDSNASTEADPLDLFLNRFKGFPYHKIILESTPTIHGQSRVESALLKSNQHQRYVPCPHCGEFQILRKGDREGPGGFKGWQNGKGETDPDYASQNCWYQCEMCELRIENHHRKPMLRKGVWVPNGCRINVHREILGTADKAGADSHGFGPLPSWYALTETWGAFARQWLQAQGQPRKLQDVVNSYMAETWKVKKSKSTEDEIAARITGTHRRGLIPAGVLFIVIAIDRQWADGGFVKWAAVGHGLEDQAWLVDWGIDTTLEALWHSVIRRTFPRSDQQPGLTPVLTAVDSGWDPKTTYEFVNTHPGVIAVKGAGTDLGGLPYRNVTLDNGTVGGKGQPLTHIATDFWETNLQYRMDERLPGESGSLTLCAEAGADRKLLKELCNATLSDKLDSRGNAKMQWVKKDDGPNDWRDAIRYGLCLGKIHNDRLASARRTFSLPRGK